MKIERITSTTLPVHRSADEIEAEHKGTFSPEGVAFEGDKKQSNNQGSKEEQEKDKEFLQYNGEAASTSTSTHVHKVVDVVA